MQSCKRTALYTRVSTALQSREGLSLDAQQRMGEDRCTVAGWTLPDVYTDVESGRKDDRPALKRLMADAAAGRVDVVLVYRLDRLGRSLVHTLQVCGELADLGVRVVSLTQPFEIDGPLGKLLLAIYASFAEMESEAIGARIRDSRRHRVATERKHYAVPPFGYVRREGVMSADPDRAPVVAGIFEDFTSGASLRSIVVGLNARGIRTRQGKLWTIAAVRVLLTNPAYIGRVTHGRMPTKRDSKGHIKRHKLPEGAYLVVEGNHPPLVDEATWTATQARLLTQKGLAPRSTAASGRYPWLALARCALCHSRLGVHNTQGNAQYSCMRIHQSGPDACSLPSIAGRLLSGAIVREMARILAEPSSQTPKRAPKKRAAGTDPAAEAARIETLIAREADLYRAGAQTLEAMTRRVRDLRSQLDAIRPPDAGPSSPPPVIPDLLAAWRDLDPPQRGALARSLLEAVTVGPDTLSATWRPEFRAYLGEGFTVPRPRLRGPASSAYAVD